MFVVDGSEFNHFGFFALFTKTKQQPARNVKSPLMQHVLKAGAAFFD